MRVRRLLLPLAALTVHLLVLAVLGAQLQLAHAAPAAAAHPHAPVADEGFDTRDPLFDLTPPEVRSFGNGGGMAEHLVAPPSVGPACDEGVASIEPPRAARLPGIAFAHVPLGRGPPVG